MQNPWSTKISNKLMNAGLLPLERQADLSTEILKKKIETVLPAAMKETGIDLWLVIGRENCEDPILKTMCTWDLPQARRIAMLAFYYDKHSDKVSPMCIGNQSVEMSRIYQNVKQPDETNFHCLGRMISELAPEKIGVNKSTLFGFCDGLSASVQDELLDAIAPSAKAALCSAEPLAIRWLQTVTEIEQKMMETLVEVTQDIIKIAFSAENVKSGTTTTDLEWIMRNLIVQSGFDAWFGPTVDLQRKGGASSRMEGEVILPGDLLHCDVGLVGKYVRLHTDMQWIAYVQKAKDRHSLAPFQCLLEKANRFQDIVMDCFADGISGNDLFANALTMAMNEGIKPMLYTHPVGTFGHGAGPTIGKYDLQGFVKGSGELPVRENTCYALELNINDSLPEWDGQAVYIYVEEDICFSGKARFIGERQTQLIEICCQED